METIQLSLPLFLPPLFSELLKKHNAARAIEVVVNPRLKKGWQVKVRSFLSKRQLIIPRHLNDAPQR